MNRVLRGLGARGGTTSEERLWRLPTRPIANVLAAFAPPLDYRIVGRTVLHSAIVGLAAGLIGAGFLAALDMAQHLLLEVLAGFHPLHAHGERVLPQQAAGHVRPWLLVFIPMGGALLAGLITELAPETRGGGGDAMIRAFHEQGGAIRRRVIWIKGLASVLTLGSGGSGGREGPTMQIGGALGSAVGLGLRVSPRERRVLMLAGVAAGISAVFRTPLGAALLATEILYRDDFESEALIPAILASVISYSVAIAIHGESVLFARAPQYTFTPRDLALYALLALTIAALAAGFMRTLRAVQRISARLPVPGWVRPGVGGLALGIVAVPLIVLIGRGIGTPGQSLGLLGGGYGAAQVAIIGAQWLPGGWEGVQLLAFLCLMKLITTSLTIGTGGSAGDFGPSLVMGALWGGAFGRAAALVLGDNSIDPGAFALVGMGTFYGGAAHVPVSSMILVCELAGSYDLLVPLMLAEAIAFVALRGDTLYKAQLPTAHAAQAQAAPAAPPAPRARVGDLLRTGRVWRELRPGTPLAEMLRILSETPEQYTFPVVDDGRLRGLVAADVITGFLADPGVRPLVVAADMMVPMASVTLGDDLGRAAEVMLATGLRQVPVLGEHGAIIGFVDEAEISRAYVERLSYASTR